LQQIRTILLLLLALSATPLHAQQTARQLMEKGWRQLVIDNDTLAFRYFGEAYIAAKQANDTAAKAQALLNMGICTFGVSYTHGMDYCLQAMQEYKKLEKAAPDIALEGRSRCLQLVSTIKGRQGKYREVIAISGEALKGFSPAFDTAGYLGLIYNSLGSAYKNLGIADSAEYFHRKALDAQRRSGNLAYLGNALIQVGNIELEHGNSNESRQLYAQAAAIADSTGNKQAQVSALLALARWEMEFGQRPEALVYNHHAEEIADGLSDKGFALKAATQLLDYYKRTSNYAKALEYRDKAGVLKDSIYSWDRQKEAKNLEIQYGLMEKERQLVLVRKEKEVVTLTNYLLWGGLVVICVLSGGAIFLLRRINKRDRMLLQAKDDLVKATEVQQRLIEEQRLLKERQMQHELELKESQLSAMAIQMMQKNELLQELKNHLETDKTAEKDRQLNRILSKGMLQDKDWDDFYAYFESINKHFYTRLKEAYPDISGNDLKICALIRLRLSIKEMAAILNISPDSVKTARYRLRKKLQLQTEDNLAEFIMQL